MGMIAAPQVIAFSSEELPLTGVNHNQPLFITVQFKSFRIPLTLVDNGAGFNVFPLRTVSQIGFRAEDIMPAVKGMKAFDNTHHDALGILVIHLVVGPAKFEVAFYIVDVESSFNLLLGSPWLHKHQVIPLTLHRMIKFC